MARNEKTSKEMASLAARAMAAPESITSEEVRSLAACVLTQAPDTEIDTDAEQAYAAIENLVKRTIKE